MVARVGRTMSEVAVGDKVEVAQREVDGFLNAPDQGIQWSWRDLNPRPLVAKDAVKRP